MQSCLQIFLLVPGLLRWFDRMIKFGSSQVRSIFVCHNSWGYSEVPCIKCSFCFSMPLAGRSHSVLVKKSNWAQYLTREAFGFFLPYQIPGCSGKATTTSQVCLPEAISMASTLHCLHALITWGNLQHFQSSLNYPNFVQMKRLQTAEPLPVDWARSMCRVRKPALLTPTLGAGIFLFKIYVFDRNL